jgi:hypothetical protein
MAPNLEHTVRAMPGYNAGLAHGVDIGLRLGLETIVKEIARQRDLAVIANATTTPGTGSFAHASRHEYARARLSDVAGVIAVYFRATH